MTVAVVQREIRKGMSQTDVTEALGSPDFVSTDSDGNDVWIYDKIATEASYSTSIWRRGAVERTASWLLPRGILRSVHYRTWGRPACFTPPAKVQSGILSALSTLEPIS